jgi:UDP-perosamine 4-acetyltransferase
VNPSPHRQRVWVLGGGGHAKVVIDTLRAAGDFEVAGVLDDDPGRHGRSIVDVPIVGDTSLESLARHGVERAVLAIGSNRVRAAIAARLDGRVAWMSVIHPQAYVALGVVLGEGIVVFAGAIVQPDAVLGCHTILNTGCSVDHDCVLGGFTHIAPGARLAGGVRVGDGSLIGLGAILLPGRAVGEWATVGAGSVVVRDVPDEAVVMGNPARSRAAREGGESTRLAH